VFASSTARAVTSQGTLLLRCAQKPAALKSEAEQELAPGQGQLAGNLALGVSTIAQYVLPRLIAAFLAENPHVQLSLDSGNTEEIVQLLLQDKVSVGLIEGPSRDQGIRIEPFIQDELVLITLPDFEFDRLSRDQLLASNLLIREQGSGSRGIVERALEKAGIKLKSFKNVMDLDSTEAIKSAVEAGLGIGFVSRWTISKELDLRALKVAQVTGVRVARRFSLALCTGPEPQSSVSAFRAFALERARLLANPSPKPFLSGSSSR
jgi:DNA-binding transcriptional LysR family regulator